MPGIRRRVLPRDIGKRSQTSPLALRHHLQPLLDEGPVDADERRDIRDRRKRDQIEQRQKVGAGNRRADLAGDLDQEQEHEPRRAKMPEAAILVAPVRVHDGKRRGQQVIGEVVVEHDYIGPRRRSDWTMRQRPAIDRDDQVVPRGQIAHGRLVRPITLVNPVGDVERGIVANGTEPVDQQRGRGRPVDVVIGEDRNPLAPPHRVGKARCGLLHVLQVPRIGHVVAETRVQEGLDLTRLDTPLSQDLGECRFNAGALHQALGLTDALGRRADPAAAGQRVGNAKEGLRHSRS